MKLIDSIITSFFSIPIFFGCGDGNYKNVKITGQVRSTIDKQVIQGANVSVKCWVYSTENWESNTVEQNVKTDENGFFELQFEKGEAVDIIINANNFKQKEESRTLKKNKMNIDIYLDTE